jgi:molybdopterin/thiamine biosynthesis adenylyltransferase
MQGLAQAIERRAGKAQGIRTLAFAVTEDLARDLSLSRREVELAALELGVLPQRYLRNYGTVGIKGQLKLLRSHVAVIGLGGLGGYVVEGLARVGVGTLTMVDGDVFCDHNLNRQLLSGESVIGKLKAQVACERVREINAVVEAIGHSCYATRDNLAELLAGTQVVVDALDRLPARLILQEVAASLGVPMIHGAIAGAMGQVLTILPGDAGLRALYGDGPIPEQGAEVELGTPAASPMMVAAWQVHETIKILLGSGELLRGRMLLMDASVGDVRVLEL